MSGWGVWINKLHQEIARGGDQPPCPFCGLPRVRRSDYIRCARCAINWSGGEALDKDPRIERLCRFLQDTARTTLVREKKSGEEKRL